MGRVSSLRSFKARELVLILLVHLGGFSPMIFWLYCSESFSGDMDGDISSSDCHIPHHGPEASYKEAVETSSKASKLR